MAAAVDLLIHSVGIVTGNTSTADGWVLFSGGRIAARGTAASWRDELPSPDTPPGAPRAGLDIIDATELAGPGALLTPGFIDIHGHGGGGRSYDEGMTAIRTARALHRAHGTTRAVLSLVTADLEVSAERVRLVAALTASDPDILGSHLEGPFLDAGHQGAHDPALLLTPTPARLDRLFEAGAGTVRQVTLAPELPGGIDAVRHTVAAGVVAAIGHTNADFAMASAAFDAGATVLTHAFNAMPGLHHRLPGPVGAAIADDRVTVEAIADGVHVHPVILRILADSVPGRLALITDAMAAAGAADGHYLLGELSVEVVGGVARLITTGSIAGSTLTQDEALRVAIGAGVPLEQAVLALTETPARAVGRPDLGRLEPGATGDAVLLDAALRVKCVWTSGRQG